MSGKNNTKDHGVTMNDYKEIVSFAKNQIDWVRKTYLWIASFITIIIIVGMGFLYSSRNEYFEEIKQLKNEVVNRIDNELSKDSIQNLIKSRINIQIDKVAENIIADQIEKKINPKLISLNKEIEILRNRNKVTQLADEAITNASRPSFEKLIKIENTANDGSVEQLAAESELIRVKMVWTNIQREITYPDFDSYDSSGIEYNKLKTKELINLLKDQRWQVRRECARRLRNKKFIEVAEALERVLATDDDLEVIHAALQSFQNVTGMPNIGMLAYLDALKWWQQNKKEVSKKLDAL